MRGRLVRERIGRHEVSEERQARQQKETGVYGMGKGRGGGGG